MANLVLLAQILCRLDTTCLRFWQALHPENEVLRRIVGLRSGVERHIRILKNIINYMLPGERIIDAVNRMKNAEDGEGANGLHSLYIVIEQEVFPTRPPPPSPWSEDSWRKEDAEMLRQELENQLDNPAWVLNQFYSYKPHLNYLNDSGEVHIPETTVAELFDCPICTNPTYPPIYQCNNGHTICSTCKGRVENRCPTCREVLGEVRCLALEKVAESLQVPCRFSSVGCCGVFPFFTKLEHEAIYCTFRPYGCPFSDECSVKGDVPFLVGHLKDDHKVHPEYGCTFSHRYVDSSTRTFRLLNCLGKQFSIHSEAFMRGVVPIYLAFLQYLGEEEEARKYRYTLQLGKSNPKLTWEGTPRSLRETYQAIRHSKEVFVIPLDMAPGDRKKLKLRGVIWNHQQWLESDC